MEQRFILSLFDEWAHWSSKLKTMRVKLSLLDKQKSLGYDQVVRVALVGKTFQPIGICTVLKAKDGRHYGDLDLDREVSGDLYFYYMNLVSQEPIFWFDGLQLCEFELEGRPTTQLKEMIIE